MLPVKVELNPHQHDGALYRSKRRPERPLEDRGATIDDPNKKIRDQHGKRWALSDQLEEAQGEPEEPPPLVRCTGEPSGPKKVNAEEESAEKDVWTHVERRVVREKKLHCEFTGAITASALDGRRYTAKAQGPPVGAALRPGGKREAPLPDHRPVAARGHPSPEAPRAGRQSALDRC